MSRRHCYSTRRGTRPSNCALSNNERQHDCQNAPPINIYPFVPASSIVHAKPRPPSGVSSTLLATPVDHIFLRARYSSPPPTDKRRRGLPPVHPKRLPVHSRRWPVHSNLSPTMFEVLRDEFRWNLQSKHRGLKGWSGDSWAGGLLRWLEEGGATGRRRPKPQ